MKKKKSIRWNTERKKKVKRNRVNIWRSRKGALKPPRRVRSERVRRAFKNAVFARNGDARMPAFGHRRHARCSQNPGLELDLPHYWVNTHTRHPVQRSLKPAFGSPMDHQGIEHRPINLVKRNLPVTQESKQLLQLNITFPNF